MNDIEYSGEAAFVDVVLADVIRSALERNCTVEETKALAIGAAEALWAASKRFNQLYGEDAE